MGLDGRDRDLERGGDFLGARALHDLAQNFFLTSGEFFCGGLSRFVFVKGVHYQPGNFGRHRRAAVENLLDGFQDFGRGRAAHEQIATGAGFERLQNLLALVINSQHHQLELWTSGLQPAHAFNARHFG